MSEREPDNILIVDDSPANRELLRCTLKMRGYNARGAKGGQEALDLAVTDPPHLILLDIAMPNMDGYEACERFKADPRLADIPIIFLSALDDPMDKVRAFRLGGADYVVKPFESAELAARIENQLRLIRLQREMTAKNEELLRKNRELLAMAANLNNARHVVLSVFSSLSHILPGTVLDDKYRILELIGSGGYGAVFKGVHVVLDRDVAVKVLKPEPTASQPEFDLLQKEGISACKVDHPNAVEVWDAGVTRDGLAYLVMELLVGRSLRRELIELKRLSLERCAEIVLPICDVLSAAHAANIIHRDIKPDNIFLHQGRGGEVIKVVDFGIAKLMNADPYRTEVPVATMDVIGTPEYVAPERFGSSPYDGRSDVYSLGVMVYEMLCGRVPFRTNREFPWAVANMHIDEEPPWLHDINPNISADVEAVVLSALAKDPEARPNAQEFGENFLKAIESSTRPGRLAMAGGL